MVLSYILLMHPTENGLPVHSFSNQKNSSGMNQILLEHCFTLLTYYEHYRAFVCFFTAFYCFTCSLIRMLKFVGGKSSTYLL